VSAGPAGVRLDCMRDAFVEAVSQGSLGVLDSQQHQQMETDGAGVSMLAEMMEVRTEPRTFLLHSWRSYLCDAYKSRRSCWRCCSVSRACNGVQLYCMRDAFEEAVSQGSLGVLDSQQQPMETDGAGVSMLAEMMEVRKPGDGAWVCACKCSWMIR
jgi:hypothetical protein